MTNCADTLFLVLDSMRVDRVSHYGHNRPTTPNLDELTDTATVYENAITPTPWTLPTHCSLFTGLFPSEHGVTNGIPDRSITVPDELETFAESLRGDGYRTGAFVNNPWVGQTSGLDRGFDEYIEWDLEILHESGTVEYSRRQRLYSKFHRYLGHSVRHPFYLVKRPFFTENLVNMTSQWLAEDTEEPTFTFMNLMEAHSPYFPPKSAFRELNLDPPGLFERRLMNTKLLGYLRGSVNPESINPRIMEYYDASLRYQDRQVGNLLDHLRAEGKFEETLIVICSDHGKTLGEYDREGQPPHYLRDINTDVPLIIKRPGQTTAERVNNPVELTNLTEYLLDGGQEDLTTYQPMADVAYFEDHIPHTSSDMEDVTRWRGIITEDVKFVGSEANDEYLFSRHPTGEQLIDNPDATRLSECRSLLKERISSLDENVSESDGERMEDIEDRTKAQLEDLGYMG